MQVSLERKEGLERTLRVDIPEERVDSAVRERLNRLAKTVRMDGFRPGKVPMRVVRDRFGGQVRQEVLGELIQSTFREAVVQEELQPAGMPRIEADEEGDASGFTYRATFEVMPEVELQPVDDLEIEKPVAEVTDEDIDRMIETLQAQRRRFEEVDRPAAHGDQVVVDFVGRLDGEPFDNGSGTDTPIEIGAGRMIDGFEEGLEGIKAGESRSIDVTFPENYGAEHLAGRDVVFEVTAKAVQEGHLPEVDEDFVRGFGIESGEIADLRADLQRNMERELRQTLRSQLREQVMNALLERNPIDVPQAMVDEQIQQLREQMKQQLGGQIPDEQLGDELFSEQAQRRARIGLLLMQVVRDAEIEATPEQVRARVEEIASAYEEPDRVIQHYYGNRELLSGVESMVVEDMAIDWLLEHAQVTERKMDFSSVMNQQAGQAA